MGTIARLLARVFPSMGTRSVLYGAHCFFIHPWFVLAAWVRLYGWPDHPAYYAAFLVHDIGYIGKRAMDDEEGETHPLWGARLMSRLFDRGKPKLWLVEVNGTAYRLGWWGAFVFLHSRFLAKRNGMPYSQLCVADKLAIALTPAWLYLPMVRLTGEIHEYMRLAEDRAAAGEPRYAAQGQHRGCEELWYARVQEYMRRWVEEHRDGREDTWTPVQGQRRPASESGVWQ